ncbi:MAG: radical SAM protein [Candidatus Woesearchaeota archaeon]
MLGVRSWLLSFLKQNYDRPYTMMIHPNYECNFKCRYCYVSRKNDCIDFKKLSSVIREAKKLGVGNIDILGGEPLLYPRFFDLIRLTDSLKIQTSIFTNGSFLTKALLNKLNKKNTIIVIKTDTRANYEFQNVPDMSYDDLLEKIDLVKRAGFRMMSFTVVTKKNVDNIDEIFELCDEKGMIPAFERYHLVKDKDVNKLFALDVDKWNGFLRKLFLYWEQKGFTDFIDFYSEVNGGVCSALYNNITVMQDGCVKSCPEAHDDLSYGNIFNDSLRNIWRSSKELRKRLKCTPDECLGCLNSGKCHGGCTVYTYNIFKDTNRKDPLCSGEFNPNYSHCGFGILRAAVDNARKK